MVRSFLQPRCVAIAVGLLLLASLSGCSTPATSVADGSRSAQTKSEHASKQGDVQIPTAGAIDVYQGRVAAYEADRASRDSHSARILYVDALLHLNQPGRAVEALVDAEAAFPGSYINAMYLGLAYELAGDLKSARHWVSKTIERNVEARSSSEWLHLAMIEARLALAKDPEWLKSHSVLKNNTHRTAEEILNAIRIQTAVRGDFGMENDVVVSDLYFEAGICAMSLSARQEYFARSLEVGPLRLREIQQLEKIRAKAQASVQLN